MAASLAGADVAIVGGGVIGLTAGWYAAVAGAQVAVVDPNPGSGAALASAGMLAPITGPRDGSSPLREMSLQAAQDYPGFVARLEEATGRPVGYRRCGTLALATDALAREEMEELRSLLARASLAAEPLDEIETRELEPYLAEGLGQGLWIPGDHQVDPALLMQGVLDASRRAGVSFVQTPAVALQQRGRRATGVSLAGGQVLSASTVVVAAGSASRGIVGLPVGAVPPLTEVVGEVVDLAPAGRREAGPAVRRHRSGEPSTYLVPRLDGGYTVGATVRRGRTGPTAVARAHVELLQSALAIMPILGDLPVRGSASGSRPAAPDGLPVIGPTPVDGLLVSTGHLHKGVLLGPWSAGVLTRMLQGRPVSELARQLSPQRFCRSEQP